jgi:hypothetical protein
MPNDCPNMSKNCFRMSEMIFMLILKNVVTYNVILKTRKNENENVTNDTA